MRMSEARRWIGRTIGGSWRIDAVLGRGGSSTVFAATKGEGDARVRVALKVLHPELASDEAVVKIFLGEARLGRAVDHPGIVRVLEDGISEDGSVFLVMELLAGQTLEELRQARGGRVPLEEMMKIGHALMDCLAAVHEARVVHRDLKPHNVFVLDGGGVKLLDFGVAKMQGRTADAAQNIVGTASFMPPEQALGLTSKVDEQSDVWSLGAMLFQCLSGEPVHIGRHLTAVMLASASTRPRSLAEAAPELNRDVIAVVDRAISYRKADRWPDIASMRAAWLGAHPHWLPTLPPPSFAADPTFMDAELLVPAGKGTGMFDPRELLPKDVLDEAPVVVLEASDLETVSSKEPKPGSKARAARRIAPIVLVVGAALLFAALSRCVSAFR